MVGNASGGCSPLKEPRKPPVSDCDGFKTDFPKARFFSKPKIHDGCLAGMAVYTVRRFKLSISSCSRSMAEIKNCYYTE